MELRSNIVIRFAELQSHLLKRVDQRLSLHGISFSEFLVLYHLGQSPQTTMRRIDLAESVGLTASGVTRLLNPMEKNRLVQKESNPRDARVSLVKLSKTGKTLLKDAMVTFEEVADSILKPLNDKQANKFLKLMNALL